MALNDATPATAHLGDMPALRAKGRRLPDRRQVSIRWLSGAVLAGMASVFLMGGALFAALDGREQFATPAQAHEGGSGPGREADAVAKGDRPGLDLNVSSSGANIMMVSTVTREGDRNVVKVRPFLKISSPLAIAPKRELDYPAFDALSVFSESGKPEPREETASDQIYGADVESEVTITIVEFDPSDQLVTKRPAQRESDIEETVRNAAPGLATGTTSLASLAYFDPSRFALQDAGFFSADGVTITAENVSLVSKTGPEDSAGIRFEERVVRVRAEQDIAAVLEGESIEGGEAETLQKALSSDLGATRFEPEDRVRIAFELRGEGEERSVRPDRVSVYRKGQHLVSIARSDDGHFVYAQEPDPIPQISAVNAPAAILPASRLPSAYDAIYRVAMSEGLTLELANKLIRIFAFDVDFNSSISPTDEISLFLSLEDGQTKPTDKSEILFASVKLGSLARQYFRFRDPETGIVDYYDETGKSAKKFLLRQPVPTGKFRSPFGMRYHPILRTRKMHWGVDWAAPRGTPILAAGNGLVAAAGWSSGYGRQTKISHPNGYVTSYSHQNRIADGVVPGARVRQGQVIGYVGSTGLSTGPHLHYEVIVNGTKVDPMRIRLPKGEVLKGNELASFQAERDRLVALLFDQDNQDSQQLAQY